MVDAASIVLIGHAWAERRVLPSIGPTLYADGEVDHQANLTDEQRGGYRLLALANLKLGFRARSLGWAKDPRRRLARVLRMHRDAIQAEIDGDWRRADFLWIEVVNQLRVLIPQREVWDAVTTEDTGGSNPESTKRLVLEELAIDTHCAFYNAYAAAQESPLHARTSFHLDRLEDLVALRGAPDEIDRALIGSALVQRVSVRSTQKRWKDALRDCLYLERNYPERQEYQLLLAQTHSAQALLQLTDSTKPTKANSNAKTLQRCLRYVEEVRKRHPENPDLYPLIALIEHRHAIELARAERLSDALLAVQRSVTYDRSFPEFFQTRAQLIEAMNKLQESVRQLEDDLRTRRNARLTARGERMRNQARTGFGPMNTYAQSDEARRISEAIDPARAHRAAHPEEPTPLVNSAQVPMLPIARAPRARSHEPLDLWLFSKQDRRVKLQAVAAASLVALLSLATVQDVRHGQARDAAFAQMTQAASVSDYSLALDGAELFLMNQPVFGQDGRTQNVRNRYTESLVGWFLEQSTRATDAEAIARVARYQSLTGQQGI